VKRLIAVVAGLSLVPLFGFVPKAEAIGPGTCTISGTIAFEPPTGPYLRGVWNIRPGAIDCKGVYNRVDYFTGQGPFVGTGTYTVLPSGTGTCLHQVGEGSVDYTFRTTNGWYHLTEKNEFVLAGAGKFTTPSLRGSFVIPPPYEGDCITTPVTRATFIAQVLLAR
jgi:hypothetical protein